MSCEVEVRGVEESKTWTNTLSNRPTAIRGCEQLVVSSLASAIRKLSGVSGIQRVERSVPSSPKLGLVAVLCRELVSWFVR